MTKSFWRMAAIGIGGIVALGGSAWGQDAEARSPDGKVVMDFWSRGSGGGMTYKVMFEGKVVVEDSPLGLTFAQGGKLAELEVEGVKRGSGDETYRVVAGKCAEARNHYNEVVAALQEKGGGRKLEVVLRAYDDGVAFRYRLPVQEGMKEFEVVSEETGFVMPAEGKAWVMVMPERGGGEFEFNYEVQKVGEMKVGEVMGMPVLVELNKGGPAAAVMQAELRDWAGARLKVEDEAGKKVMRADLTPLVGQERVKVKGVLPCESPWRVVMVGERAGEMIESTLVMNLNEPCRLADVSWIHPGKVLFPWWNGYLVGKNGKRGGVNTATYKEYVDGAAELGLPFSSIDGLDIAWYGGRIPGHGEHDVTVPVKELDVQAVMARAKEKGVRVRVWVAAEGLRKYLDKALDTYEKWGVEGIMVDFIARDDQDEVNWLEEMIRKAAEHHLTVTLHNVSPPTGLSRTYPNLLTREAVRNQEWDKWNDQGITPEHNVRVAYVRMLAGHLDYHMGAFRSVRNEDYRPRDIGPDVMGTRCEQLAMYVVYEDPEPMAVDYPAAYRGRVGVDVLRDVPTVWDETKFVCGETGEWIVVARRKGEEWWVGGMGDSVARELKVPLGFLGEGKWVGEEWEDDLNGGPNGVVRKKVEVSRGDVVEVKMGVGGGMVMRMKREVN